jgi:hypothetical protein
MTLPAGKKAPHLPDALLIKANGEAIAIEVELTAKKRERVLDILKELSASYHRTWYFVAQPAWAVVEGALTHLPERPRKSIQLLLVLLSRWLPPRLTQWRGFWPLVALIGLAGLACLVLVTSPFRMLHTQLVQVLSVVVQEAKAGSWSALRVWAALRPLWWESLLLAPGAAFLAHLLTPQSPRQHLLAANAQQADALRAASKRVQRRMARRHLPDRVGEQPVLGLPVAGDLHSGLEAACSCCPPTS